MDQLPGKFGAKRSQKWISPMGVREYFIAWISMYTVTIHRYTRIHLGVYTHTHTHTYQITHPNGDSHRGTAGLLTRNIYTYTYIYIGLFTYMFIIATLDTWSACICVYICMYTHTCIYTNTQTYARSHTHAYTWWRSPWHIGNTRESKV